MGPLFLRLISFHFRPKLLREAATEAQILNKIYQTRTTQYCKFGGFREGFIFAKLRLCGVS